MMVGKRCIRQMCERHMTDKCKGSVSHPDTGSRDWSPGLPYALTIPGHRLLTHALLGLPQQGFGNIDGEYWLGLENIYWLTNQGNYKLLVTMEDWSGRKVFAEYASFRLEPENEYYKLRLGRYHGNAGDSFTWHNGKQFTTLDRDHDVYTGRKQNQT